MTPDELARACADAMAAADLASREVGIDLRSVSPGSATTAMRVAATMVNGHGICHGGYAFLLSGSDATASATSLFGAPTGS